MERGLSRSVLVASIAVLVAAHVLAATPTDATSAAPPILQRFLALSDPSPTSYRALRHLEARNDKFDMSAWMDVWTEIDAAGFKYRIAAGEGSEAIRSRVFRETLETERRLWASATPDAGSVTPANYIFDDRGALAHGLPALSIKPRPPG